MDGYKILNFIATMIFHEQNRGQQQSSLTQLLGGRDEI